jgi:glycosyltransferase involved in cell wall biosynthesis
LSFLEKVTVLILTYNEAPNIARTLDALSRFTEIVVLDSGSTDGTIATASRYPNVRIQTRPFDQHAEQWNHGLTACGIERAWVLALDADYVLPPELVEEIDNLPAETLVDGYRVHFRYCINGHRLSAALYPPHIALYRRDRAHYVQDGHTQRVVLQGRIAQLAGFIDHDDRKSLARWLQSQQRYAHLEAEHLLSSPRDQLRRIDRLRLLGWPMPILVPAYTLLIKLCLLDGIAGWIYVLHRTLAEVLIALEIGDRKIRNKAERRR